MNPNHGVPMYYSPAIEASVTGVCGYGRHQDCPVQTIAVANADIPTIHSQERGRGLKMNEHFIIRFK